MLVPVSASTAAGALLLLLLCVLCCAGDPASSRIHFSRNWPASVSSASASGGSSSASSSSFSPARRHRGRGRASPRAHCGRACQVERSKALSPCEQPARDAGWRCGEELVRYSYVAATRSCVPFLYGGCRGNANNFPTFVMCRDRCKTVARATASTQSFGVSKTARTGGGRRGPTTQLSTGFRPRLQPPRRDQRVHFGVGPRMGGRGGSAVDAGVAPRFGGRRGSTVDAGVAPRFGGRRGSTVDAGVAPRFGGRRGSTVDAGVAPRFGRRRGSKTEAGGGSRSRIFFPGPAASRWPRRPQRTKTQHACRRQPRQTGWPCGDATVRYSYLRTTNSCVPFEYKGCGGSTNSFATFTECRDLCKAPPPTPGVPGEGGGVIARQPQSRRCRMRWQAGPCRGQGPMMRYYYNDRKARCEWALYSGCGGNSNRFHSRHSCERACRLG